MPFLSNLFVLATWMHQGHPTYPPKVGTVPPPSRPAPTPCRQARLVGDDWLTEVPDIRDTTIEKPQPGQLRISADAVEGRLRRFFTPNVKGEFKVSAEIVQQWKTKKGRRSLEQVFQSVGFNKDRFCRKWGIALYWNLTSCCGNPKMVYNFSCISWCRFPEGRIHWRMCFDPIRYAWKRSLGRRWIPFWESYEGRQRIFWAT